MLRDKSLIPLSRQHQHALALCVRIDRAQPIPAADLEAWRAEVTQQFEQEIKLHFAAEEEVLFPIARNFAELAALVKELIAEHDLLRREFARLEKGGMSAEELPLFAKRLSEHVRKEERHLFERLQQLIKPEDMTALGVSLQRALQEASQACILPNEVTRIRAR
ncbi:MAG: hemerythrin domain-containing protein [Candidatus Sulfotelmatobacter sp.]